MRFTIFILQGKLRKCLIYIDLLEKTNAEYLQDFAKAAVDIQFLLDDRHKHVNADSDPDLDLHGVDGRTVECLDPKVLLDPFEEQFDLPSAFVQLCDRQGGEYEIVGDKNQQSFGFHVEVAYPSKRNRIILRRFWTFENDCLVGTQSCRPLGTIVGYSRGCSSRV